MPKVATKKPSMKKELKDKKSISVSVLGVDGKTTGKMSLPVELFGRKVPDTLLAQAVRVYLANQREGSAKTKTRGEVEGSTKKIYKQKGTGRARHGGIRAPIFVGGGIAFGPVPQDYSLKMPTKMRRVALFGALTERLSQGDIVFVEGLEAVSDKTKHMDKALSSVGKVSSTLLVVSGPEEKIIRSARNIKDVDIIQARELYVYTLLHHKKIIMMKSAVSVLKETFLRARSTSI